MFMDPGKPLMITGVITRFLERCKQRLPLIIYGDGTQTRDFINVQDVVEAVLKSLENKDAEGEVFNVGSGKPTSINELARIILEPSRVTIPISYESPRVGDIKNSYADISKAEALLEYKPKFSLKYGLRLLLEEE